jgi:hypothetical protein
MTLLYSFEDEGLEFVGLFGDNIMARTRNTHYDDYGTPYYTYTYYKMYMDGEYGFYNSSVWYDDEVIEFTDSYVITWDGYDERYNFYNTEFNCILSTANPMTVYDLNGNIVIETELAGHTLFYTVD